MRFWSPLLSVLLVPVMAGWPLLAQTATIPGPASDSGDAPSLQLRVLNPNSSAGDFTVEVTDMAGAPVSNAAVVFRLPDDSSSTFADGSLASVTYTDAGGRAHLSSGVYWGSSADPITVRITAAKGTAHAGLLVEHSSSPAANLPAAKPSPSPLPAPARMAAQPGSISSAPGPSPGISIDSNVPIRHFASTGADAADIPGISISSAGPASGSHIRTKWILILAAAAAGGAAIAMTHKGGSSSGSSSSGGGNITLGTPTVTVGHP